MHVDPALRREVGMFRRAVVGTLFLAALVAAGCGRGKDHGADDEIRIGVIAELTGDLAAVGASCRNAIELAARRVNEAGGIEIAGRRHQVRIFLEDNGDKAEQSVATAQKLIAQDRVLAIIGPNPSRCAIPAAEIAEASRVVLISPWSTAPRLTLDARTGAPKKYVFRAGFIDPFQGGVIARFARQTLGAGRAAALYDVASEYNKGIAEVFKDAFTRDGGQVVAFETYTTGDKDFSAQLTKIRNANPDVVFLPNYYTEVPLQVQQAHRLGLDKVAFIGGDSWGSPELLSNAGGIFDGCYFSTHYAADVPTPQVKEFIASYRAAYGTDPDDVAALSTDAFRLVMQALTTGGKPDREALRDALARVQDYEGITGRMRFNGTGDPVKSAVILKIENGAFKFFSRVEP
jgi:branched-chain amino acid transport system substrate-binding protein